MLKILGLYYRLYDWLVSDVQLTDEDREQVHMLLAGVLFTSILMWSYTLNSLFCIPSNNLKVVAISMTLIHLFSPALYKITKSIAPPTNTFIAAGLVFQFTHAFYTGGFYSVTTVWFSILPLLAGVVLGRWMLISWSVIAFVAVLILLGLDDQTSDIITEGGRVWSYLNISMGYTVLNLTMMFVYLFRREQYKENLNQKTDSVRTLLRIVSHDVANPLMTLKLYLNRIKKRMGNTSGEFAKSIGGIEKSANMIQKILEHSRKLEALNSGKIQLERVPISLNDIIDNSIFVFKDSIERKNIIIEYDYEMNSDVVIYGDPISLKNQVFNNLFSNSIKFMDHGGKISIEVDKKLNEILVKYKDNGEGIDQKEILDIFRPDVKTSHKGKDGEVGTGFGMPLLYAVLNELGATIEVVSIRKEEGKLDHGTEFNMKFIV
ncbi:MAG: HAMP domain-containing histidine kinase [Oligoflexia bacterium]|nr:HAMP domain-containing histidine kinase [Oligoflexia bacterium]